MSESPRIFLSYAREDSYKVRIIYRRLTGLGCRPWLDSTRLKPGDRWEDEIYKAVLGSQFFIACLSMNSVRKIGFVQREWEIALEVNRASAQPVIIPLKLDQCTAPVGMRDFNYLTWKDDDATMDSLRDALHLDLSQPAVQGSLLSRLWMKISRSR
jgi:hypothetical protein